VLEKYVFRGGTGNRSQFTDAALCPDCLTSGRILEGERGESERTFVYLQSFPITGTTLLFFSEVLRLRPLVLLIKVMDTK